MNKKYLPSALIMYLNYFIHGVGCSILGQAVIKEALAAAWGVEAMAITAISAALGLGRLIALPFAGPLSDKMCIRDRSRPNWLHASLCISGETLCATGLPSKQSKPVCPVI